MTVQNVEVRKPEGNTKNKSRVPKSQWKKWGSDARITFNWLYGLMVNFPDLFNHPKAIKMNQTHWKTVAWNTAWLAADAVHDALKRRKK